MAFEIREARESDTPLILQFIRNLAEYERLAHLVVATEESLHATLFGSSPFAEVLIAEEDGTAAGFALFFHNYSTFLAQPASIWRIFSSSRSIAAEGMGKRCWRGWRRSRGTATAGGWSGRCSIGMSRRSRSTNRSVRGRWRIGERFG